MWTTVTKKRRSKKDVMSVAVTQQTRTEIIPLTVLTKEQISALEYVSGMALKKSMDAMEELIKKAQTLEISENMLNQILEYFRSSVPLIIHIDLKTLEFLASDTHYRNQFETKTSGGKLSPGLRSVWENELFNGAYNKSLPFDRCKYGCMNTNTYNLPIRDAISYGDNYLILKSHMRSRVTCCYNDTSNRICRENVGTLDNYAHILAMFSDDELKSIAENVCSKTYHLSKNWISYKEIQIHGPVTIDSDVHTLVMNRRHEYKENKHLHRLVEKFRSRGIDVIESDA